MIDIEIKPNDNQILLSNHPVEVYLSDLKSWLSQDNEVAKKHIIDFIYHRLHGRYVVPLLHVPREYKSGFLIMASACLMIETMQSFWAGKDRTPPKKGLDAFKDFFMRERQFFPEIYTYYEGFYYNVRCGILHQAETNKGYRIWWKGPLFNPQKKIINANRFLEALNRCLRKYIDDLKAASRNDDLWTRTERKVGYICKNCED